LRERIPEFAVLKTLGFTDRMVALLVLGESLLLCLLSAAVGILLARLAFVPLGRVLGNIEFRTTVLYGALLITVVLVLVSGLPPALHAQRLSIVDALRRGR
jgi:putative ABC transport system permease protein